MRWGRDLNPYIFAIWEFSAGERIAALPPHHKSRHKIEEYKFEASIDREKEKHRYIIIAIILILS